LTQAQSRRPAVAELERVRAKGGDYVAMSLIRFFGEGHLQWASDYPHPVWPNSRQAIERQMGHLSPQMHRKLTHDTAAALYGLGGA